MKMILVIVFVTVIITGLTFGTSKAEAYGFGMHDESFISKLASKLGLDTAKIQTAMDELRGEHQTDMQKIAEKKLTQAVQDGKITEDQKSKILAKQKEIQEKMKIMRENKQSVSKEVQRVEMEKMRSELETWAKENNIDLSYLHGFIKGWRMGGTGNKMEKGMGRGMWK